MGRKRFLVRPSQVVSKHDGEIHHISAGELMRLHGVHPSECVVIREGEDWPQGFGPLETEEKRTAAGFKLLTPDFSGEGYGRE